MLVKLLGKTFNAVSSALGGVLFIDEAYSITDQNENSNSYGAESIATLLKLMEDYNDRLIIIFAGYAKEMEEFENANPGLKSRIGYKINFPDYNVDQLLMIFTNLLKNNGFEATSDAIEEIKNVISEASKIKNFGNGRYINNIFQKILIEHAKNVELCDDSTNLYEITKDDVKYNKLVEKNDQPKNIGF